MAYNSSISRYSDALYRGLECICHVHEFELHQIHQSLMCATRIKYIIVASFKFNIQGMNYVFLPKQSFASVSISMSILLSLCLCHYQTSILSVRVWLTGLMVWDPNLRF